MDSLAVLHNNRFVIIYISSDDNINCFGYVLKNALSR